MSQHLQKIFDVWDGNAEAMAAEIGETGVTVRQWRNRGSIHSDHWPRIIKAAASRGAQLRPEDFWPADVVADLPDHIRGDSADEHSGAATKTAENICRAGGADSHGPFSSAPAGATADSSQTCSTTREPPQSSAASPTCRCSTASTAKAA